MLPRIVRLIAAMVLLAGLSSASATSTSTVGDTQAAGLSVELGHGDFLTYCAPCHGVEGRGDGTVAEFLTIPAADLTQLTKRNAGFFPRERVAEVIDGRIEMKVHGGRDMPIWGDWFMREAASSNAKKQTHPEIVRERIAALVSYLETIQEK